MSAPDPEIGTPEPDMGTPPVLEHDSTGRSRTALLVLLAIWGALVALWLVLEASPWIVLALGLVTVPAVRDFALARHAWLRLDDQFLRWGSGKAEGEVALARIKSVRMDTRLDLSVRVRVVLDTDKRITVPQDALPPHKVLETALTARHIPLQRHHFGWL